MKKILFLLVPLFLVSLGLRSQNCGDYIELVGQGVHGLSTADLVIPGGEDADSLIVEAIYKSKTAPSEVEFSSDYESFNVSPVDVLRSGTYNTDYYTVQYIAKMMPANVVSLDILANDPSVYSFAAYVFKSGTMTTSYLNGELYHVWRNEPTPLSLDIPVPVTADAKDIKIRFGVSELNDDDRYAIFKFYADGIVKDITVQSWDELAGETDSYTIKSVEFNDLPGYIDKVEMELISERFAREGDSYVAGVTLLDIACEQEGNLVCSYTQGFYGSPNGKTCDGVPTTDLLDLLLSTDLVLGMGGNTLTIDSPECVYALLPGGGPSKALSGSYDCSNLNSLLDKKGRLKNTLLAQGITLGLNMKNNPGLANMQLDGAYLIQEAVDCSDPDSEGLPGTEKSLDFSMAVLNYLGAGATFGDLFELVNKAIGGMDVSPLSLSDISDAATLVNEGFDECKVVVDGPMLKSAEGFADAASQESKLKLYPNPVQDHFTIELTNTESIEAIFIFNTAGQTISSIDVNIQQNMVDVSNLNLTSGTYILTVYTNGKTINSQFTVY